MIGSAAEKRTHFGYPDCVAHTQQLSSPTEILLVENSIGAAGHGIESCAICGNAKIGINGEGRSDGGQYFFGTDEQFIGGDFATKQTGIAGGLIGKLEGCADNFLPGRSH